MARIVIAWELGGGLGHCAKLVPIATGLLSAGHEVYFAGRDVTTVQRLLSHTPVKLLQAPCLLARPARVIWQERTFAHILHNVGFGDDNQLRSLVTSWRNLFDLVRPDAAICEHSPSALLASRWTDCRRVAIGTGFSLPPDISPLPDLCPWVTRASHTLDMHEAQILERVNRLLAADRLMVLDRLSQIYGDVDERFLVTFRELDHHRDRGPAEYWGNWSLEGGASLTPPAAGDKPRVFAYLKPSAGAWKAESVLELLRGEPFDSTAYIPNAPPAVLRFQTAELRIVSDRVDLASELKNCDLAIVNGTAGTSTRCLLAGVPLLLLPLFLEQIVFSRRVVDLGAGLIVPPYRVEQFASRLRRLLDDHSFRASAQGFARLYSDYDPVARQRDAVSRIARYLTSSAL